MNTYRKKVNKRAGSLFLLFTLSLAASAHPGAGAAAAGFNDVPAAHWAKSGIDTAVNKGYVEGYPGGLFMPDASVSRAEFIKMIVTATGQPVEAAEGKWYEGYVAAAQQAGLYTTSDFANSELEWNRKITRAEMARIAARAAGLKTKEDDKWMYLAAKAGLISGLGAGKLGEQEHTTRAQSVTAVQRVLTVNSGGKLKVDKYAVSSAELAWHKTNIFTMMPEYFNYKSQMWTQYDSYEDQWREDKLTLSSKNNKYVATLHELVAIDLEDPNDPNLKNVPPIKTLRWDYGAYEHPGFPVSNYKKAYLLYWKSTVKNDAPEHYKSYVYANIEIDGIGEYGNPKIREGVLTKSSSVYVKANGDSPYRIIPKVGGEKLERTVSGSIRTPSFSNYYYLSESLLSVYPHGDQ
ncbi:S-layer homology domain-containing protein [Paenibacillus camerounensis]|uniref:S-layer homology domain-containing protein n=1 Tax=Paenibacillus camerounensis TaxID=1243663 RepID=UPI000A87EC03|nr:S-layer homology domain-containing protein [Paenibacillus camerounensis]